MCCHRHASASRMQHEEASKCCMQRWSSSRYSTSCPASMQGWLPSACAYGHAILRPRRERHANDQILLSKRAFCVHDSRCPLVGTKHHAKPAKCWRYAHAQMDAKGVPCLKVVHATNGTALEEYDSALGCVAKYLLVALESVMQSCRSAKLCGEHWPQGVAYAVQRPVSHRAQGDLSSTISPYSPPREKSPYLPPCPSPSAGCRPPTCLRPSP